MAAEGAGRLSRVSQECEQYGWRLTLRLLIRLSSLYVLGTVRGRADNWR
jgi:hypothetical protein